MESLKTLTRVWYLNWHTKCGAMISFSTVYFQQQNLDLCEILKSSCVLISRGSVVWLPEIPKWRNITNCVKHNLHGISAAKELINFTEFPARSVAFSLWNTNLLPDYFPGPARVWINIDFLSCFPLVLTDLKHGSSFVNGVAVQSARRHVFDKLLSRSPGIVDGEILARSVMRSIDASRYSKSKERN